MTREARSKRCPEDVLGWIPWYADGHLDAMQRGAVEAHAAECADCRAELDMVAGAPFEIDEDLPDPDRVFAEVTRRIAASDPAAPFEDCEDDASRTAVTADQAGTVRSDEDWARIADWVFIDSADSADSAEPAESGTAFGRVIQGPWARHGGLWAAAAALVLLATGALGGAWWQGAGTRSGATDVYRTASAAAPTAIAAVATLDVVFREAASSSEISTALRAAGAEIVAGPSSLGVYRLRVTSQYEDVDEAARQAAAVLMGSADASGAPGIAVFAEAVP